MKKIALIPLVTTFLGILVALSIQETTMAKEGQVDVPGPVKQGVLGAAGLVFALAALFLATQNHR